MLVPLSHSFWHQKKKKKINIFPAFHISIYLVIVPLVEGVGTTSSALDSEGVLDIDITISLETTWHAMEDLVTEGLVRSIGIR